SCLIIYDSISKSFVRLSRHKRVGPDAFSSRPSKYLSREQHFSARTVCVNALYKSRDGACALRYSILAARIGLDRATHVSKQQFDVEFPICRDVWEKLVGLRHELLSKFLQTQLDCR